MPKFHIPMTDALHWKLKKGQTLYNALCNYAFNEFGVTSQQFDNDVYAKDGDFVVEIQLEDSDTPIDRKG